MSKQMTKEYRLRRAMASLLDALAAHGDHRAAWNALRAVHPEAATRLVKACADSEIAAGMVLTMGVSAETEFSMLDRLLIGNPMDELPRMERWVAQLQRLDLHYALTPKA